MVSGGGSRRSRSSDPDHTVRLAVTPGVSTNVPAASATSRVAGTPVNPSAATYASSPCSAIVEPRRFILRPGAQGHEERNELQQHQAGDAAVDENGGDCRGLDDRTRDQRGRDDRKRALVRHEEDVRNGALGLQTCAGPHRRTPAPASSEGPAPSTSTSTRGLPDSSLTSLCVVQAECRCTRTLELPPVLPTPEQEVHHRHRARLAADNRRRINELDACLEVRRDSHRIDIFVGNQKMPDIDVDSQRA